MTRRRRLLLVLALIAAVLLLAAGWLSRPRTIAGLVTGQVGNALGLEIRAEGATHYRLRGTPQLVLREVSVREPGSTQPLLTARRILVALPWSTLRAGGSALVAQRVELDAPHLDLPALQHWLASRPPSAKRLPTLTRGLRIRQGEIANDDWHIDGIDVDLPLLAPAQPLRARLRGRYRDAPLAIPVDVAVAVIHPEALIADRATGFAAYGRISVERGAQWRLPAYVALSGPLRLGADELHVVPARLGVAASYESAATHIPFALGLHGPLRFDEATWTLAPVGLALRGRDAAHDDPVPTLDAQGTLALGRTLVLRLDGALAGWPPSWPALPPPLGQSQSALPFALRYDGSPALDDVAALRLRRDATRFDGRFRLPEVLAWIDQTDGTPLPPLSGSLQAPTIEISGARLEGVQVEMDAGERPSERTTP
ncbi:hypothetical protein ACFPN1_11845 [Lysobacter yangpyeongensis]|uniref:AsmA domain-containing protein n=1 Tax=Lysobacter yangpyeongensis TaxID=346182 RepID=A0ABW0SNR6_9GAMM